MKESIPQLPVVQAAAEAGDTCELLRKYTVPNYGRLSLAPVSGAGSWLVAEGGKRYLDFGAGVAVCSLGHCPPEITRALTEQSAQLIHCSNWYQIRGQGEVARFLVEKVMRAAGKCFFCNSGAEANEGLLKLARKFGQTVPRADGRQRMGIITFHHSFHGRTFGGISATAQDKVKHGFEPLLEGFTHLAFNDVAALEAAVNEDTVAILVEPVQGEGGIHQATPEFLRACAQLCRERNALLLFDEVQSGLGRTGHWGGWHGIAPEIVPDGVSWAKGIAGGFPLGAVWIRQRELSPEQPAALCDLLGPGSHGTTYGGNPLGCAVALAVLRAIDEQGLCAHAEQMGAAILTEVRSWHHPALREARGLGLMLGFVLNTEAMEAAGTWRAEEGPASIAVVKRLMAAGLLTIGAGADVIRWLPPLNVSREDISQALTIFREVLDAISPPVSPR